MAMETFLLLFILVSGFYMAWNIGANDVANAMGTSVGSGALSLKQAIVIAGVLEFCGAFFFGSYVSETVESGIINVDLLRDTPLVLAYGMVASLISAGIWLQIASYFGWPVSTTHSIIGSVVGFGAIVVGVEGVYWDQVAYIAFSWIASPFLGGLFSYIIFSILLRKIFYVPNPLRAARKITPFLVFLVMTTISFALLYGGFERFDLGLPYSVLISLAVGSICAIFGYFSVRRIKNIEQDYVREVYDPRSIAALEKARRNLQYVQARSSGDLGSQVTELVDHVKDISLTMKEAVDIHATRSEYRIVERIFAKLQLMSACLMAFSHGANDVANAIGPLSAAVRAVLGGAYEYSQPVPLWTLALGGVGIVIGLATWGWRVMETIGRKLTELTPTRGFAAEFGAAITILVASRLGFPISATHTLVGAVLGVGFARGLEALNLTTMRDILVSWIVTIPIGAALAVIIYFGISNLFGLG